MYLHRSIGKQYTAICSVGADVVMEKFLKPAKENSVDERYEDGMGVRRYRERSSGIVDRAPGWFYRRDLLGTRHSSTLLLRVLWLSRSIDIFYYILHSS